MITITSPREGFWRAGVRHPKGTTEYTDETFSDEQLDVLEAEPLLMVAVSGEAVPDPFLGEEPPQAQPPEEVVEEVIEDVVQVVAEEIKPPTRLSQLVKAIAALDPDDLPLWTKSGKPQVSALEDITGLAGITAGERDAAFASFKKIAG